VYEFEGVAQKEGAAMSNGAGIESGQELSRIARECPQGRGEVSVVASPGSRAAAWAIKVKGNLSYNVYNVVAVVTGDAGTVPSEIGQQMQAVNLAESFGEQGTLPAGTYAVMFRVGDKNVFHVKP
jgi:hypothetical protein